VEGGGRKFGGNLHGGRQARKEPFAPLAQREPGEVVGSRREVFYFFEFGHAAEAAVQIEEPAMIAATEVRELAGLVDHQVTAMGADIGQEAEGIVFIPHEGNGFVEVIFEDGERAGVTGSGGLVAIGDELPGRGEDQFF
jgi:hypothetical protein